MNNDVGAESDDWQLKMVNQLSEIRILYNLACLSDLICEFSALKLGVNLFEDWYLIVIEREDSVILESTQETCKANFRYSFLLFESSTDLTHLL